MSIERRYQAREGTPAIGAGTHIFLFACVAMVVTFLAWSAIGRLDVVATAPGEVVPASQIKTVQHLEGGIVRGILVREGDRVRRDQPLVELEPTRSESDVDELKVRLLSLRTVIARLEAEVSGADAPLFPDDLVAAEPILVVQASEMFRARRNRIENQIRSQKELIIQRQQEYNEVSARLRNNAIAVKLVEEQTAISTKLLKLDLTNRMQHLNLLKEQALLKGKIEEDRALLPKTEAARNEAASHLETLKLVFAEEARKELDETRRTLKELSQRLLKYEDSLKRTVIRAPVDGTVKTLYVTTRGAVIAAGGTVVDMVPSGDRLVIEAKLATQDIGYVRAGQPAKVQLASAEAVRFGSLDGRVVQVSPDTYVSKQGGAFYKVRVETEGDRFQLGDLRYDLFPGMQVQTTILTGTRTVLQYVLDPYLTSLRTAMQER